jgi:hypothetical protein
MSEFEQLRREFETFEVLPTGEDTWKQRKGMADSLENRVKAGGIALTREQFLDCRDGDQPLGRILAYLLVQHDKVPGDLNRVADLRASLDKECNRLRAIRFGPGNSTMPLHYSLAAYLCWLEREPQSVTASASDDKRFEQIHEEMTSSGLDPGGHVRRKVEQIRSILQKSENTVSNPVVAAAQIAKESGINQAKIGRVGLIIVALVGLLGTISAALIHNWDKMPWHKSPQPIPAVAPANPPAQ